MLQDTANVYQQSLKMWICLRSPLAQPPLLRRGLPIGGEPGTVWGRAATDPWPQPHADEPLHGGRPQQPLSGGQGRRQVRRLRIRNKENYATSTVVLILCSSPFSREPKAEGASEVFWLQKVLGTHLHHAASISLSLSSSKPHLRPQTPPPSRTRF